MKKYEFEIHASMDVTMEAEDDEDIEDVRVRVINKLNDYDIMSEDVYVDDGRLIE